MLNVKNSFHRIYIDFIKEYETLSRIKKDHKYASTIINQIIRYR